MAEQTRLTDAELEALRGHTPGPWNRRQQYTELRDEIGVGGRVIAIVPVRIITGVYRDEQKIVSSEEGEANAGLVIAAPALLAEVIERRTRDAAFAELVEAAEAYREADQEYGSCAYGSYEHEQRLLAAKTTAAERFDAVLATVRVGAPA